MGIGVGLLLALVSSWLFDWLGKSWETRVDKKDPHERCNDPYPW
jgi:hypothetical protein